MEERAETIARCVVKAGGALDNCVGFIDGTGTIIECSGGAQQRSVYSGHKRTHIIKLQSFVTPDGLYFHLTGPQKGVDKTVLYTGTLEWTRL